ncbi:MAG: transketolase family protein [Clostridia bacterium]|nr:transketolase family protein [Clostridia bacterium]
MSKQSARIAFTRTLSMLARKDPRLFALATDSRGSAALDDFARELPEQFVECGIAEQNAIGIAAGLANTGKKPFICGPACFYSLRSSEQIKIDLAYSNSNVKIIGVSGGVSYGALGASHHATQDVALMRAIPGLTVVLPADGNQTEALTRGLASHIGPVYVRMGRGEVPDVYEKDPPFTLGKANVLRRGSDVSLIACGEMVYFTLETAKLLAQNGIEATVIDMHTLKPLDEEVILDAAAAGAVVSIEEHNIHGGLGSAIASLLAQRRPTFMRILGLPDEVLYTGTSAQVFNHYGLTPQGIAQAAKELLKVRKDEPVYYCAGSEHFSQ